MTELENTNLSPESTSALERVAQGIIIAYAWVAGPAMTEKERVRQELAKSHRLEVELDCTSIVG